VSESPSIPKRTNISLYPPEFAKLRDTVLKCRLCHLCETRRQVVFGVGCIDSPCVFVGEAPGEEEDRQGKPFVGRAGQLLTKLLDELGVSRNNIYITNILKCRPPNNRQPRIDEIASCVPYLVRQLDFIKPKVICALGNVAAQTLLSTQLPMKQLRGQFREYATHNLTSKRAPLIFSTFHPAYVLRNPSAESVLRDDLKILLNKVRLIE